MKPQLLLLLFAMLSGSVRGQLFTITIPEPPPVVSVTNILVAPGEDWHWRRGTNAPQTDWLTTADNGLDGTWRVSPGGFGFGDDAISSEATRVNPGMSNIHSTLYIRRSLVIPGVDTNADLILTVDFDDGFVAYLDGVELARRNVPGTPGTPVLHTATTGGVSHEASCCQSPNAPVAINLGPVGDRLTGTHVLALIGVNQVVGSSDFHLIPSLATVRATSAAESLPLVTHGLYALATTNQVLLEGSNTIPAGVRVTVNGDDASLDSGKAFWSYPVILRPGWNSLYLAVHDVHGTILTNFEQGIAYQAGTLRVGGSLAGITVWNDPATIVQATENVVVPAGASLTMEAGVVILFPRNTSLTAMAGGVINVRGTEAAPVMFLPAGTNSWGSIMATGSNSILHVRHAEVVAGQVRVESGGDLLIEDSVVRDLPDVGREVVKAVAGLGLTMRRTYMTRFAEGDSRDTPVLVEGCLMEGFLVDGMDIKATNSPLVIRRSTFRNADPNNSNADAIDFGPGAGAVDSCLIHDFPDKGVSIGGAPGTWIRNSLIYRCGIGVSAYASSDLLIEGTTVSSCLNGILFRDNPTRAVGAATNLIVWGNTTNFAVLNTSALTFDYSDIQGGVVYPGIGNFSADPLFAAPEAHDYRLLPGSPALTATSDGGPVGVRFPVGGLPSAPARFLAISRPNDLVEIVWADTSENEDGFIIEQSSDRIFWDHLTNAPGGSVSMIIPKPLTDQLVYYRARATNDIGSSLPSNPARATPVTDLALSISHPSPTSVALEFTAAPGRPYVVQARSSFDARPWTNWMAILSTVGGPHRITNEVAGAQGFYRLTAP